MPPDLPNEQELTLKKRARRRLVGAIALVLLMVVILPQILQDRALLAQQEPIKITMPEAVNVASEPVANLPHDVPVSPQPQDTAITEPVTADAAGNNESYKETVTIKQSDVAAVAQVLEVKQAEIKAPAKTAESFTVQVGVYSDAANVKRLQEQLKQAGFSTHTENVKTDKGESLRLKAGSFSSRQDAVAALAKVKGIGLPGMVVADE